MVTDCNFSRHLVYDLCYAVFLICSCIADSNSLSFSSTIGVILKELTAFVSLETLNKDNRNKQFETNLKHKIVHYVFYYIFCNSFLNEIFSYIECNGL